MVCFLPIVRGGVFPSFRAVSAAPLLSALREVQFLELGYRGGDVSRGPSILPQTAVAVVRVVGVTVGNAAAGAAPTFAAQHPPPTGGIRLAPDEKVRGALAPVARFASVGDGLVARAFRAGALRALRRLDRLLRRLARGASSAARASPSPSEASEPAPPRARPRFPSSSSSSSSSLPLAAPPPRFSRRRAALQLFEHVVTSSQHRSHFFLHVNGLLHTTHVFTGRFSFFTPRMPPLLDFPRAVTQSAPLTPPTASRPICPAPIRGTCRAPVETLARTTAPNRRAASIGVGVRGRGGAEFDVADGALRELWCTCSFAGIGTIGENLES